MRDSFTSYRNAVEYIDLLHYEIFYYEEEKLTNTTARPKLLA